MGAVPESAANAAAERNRRTSAVSPRIPLIGILITAAARLMLGITERLAADEGLDWAFCDTDSMALVRPAAMERDAFTEAVERARAWFAPLNPYRVDVGLLKLEDANFALDADGKPTSAREPLYCWAISAKRYTLFNPDPDGQPILRKASAHGLGHLVAPYDDAHAAAGIPAPRVPADDLGVTRWQHDLWYRIVEAALDGHPDQVDSMTSRAWTYLR